MARYTESLRSLAYINARSEVCLIPSIAITYADATIGAERSIFRSLPVFAGNSLEVKTDLLDANSQSFGWSEATATLRNIDDFAVTFPWIDRGIIGGSNGNPPLVMSLSEVEGAPVNYPANDQRASKNPDRSLLHFQTFRSFIESLPRIRVEIT